MKITEETKLKDFIPEGYEISTQTISTNGIYIDFKKKEVKDFKWYAQKYLNYNPDQDKSGSLYNVNEDTNRAKYSNLLYGHYALVPFEFKIGLLKFICDDIKLPIKLWLSGEYSNTPEYEREIIDLKSICPYEFLNSIFK